MLNQDIKRRTVSLSEMMSMDDEHFVRSCFNVIVGREADPSGLTHYLGVLRANGNRNQILSDLCASPEAAGMVLGEDILKAVRQYRRSRFWRFHFKRPARRPAQQAAVAPVTSPEHVPEEQRRNTDALLARIDDLQQGVLQLQHSILHNRETPTEVLGGGGTRYLFNLSTSNHWRRHAVGIVRVERELGKYLRRFGNVDFVIWDGHERVLKKLLPFQVDNILADAWCINADVMASYVPAQLTDVAIKPGDTYISLGLDWDHAPTHQLVTYLAQFGARAVLACHDTVPVQFPEFVARDGLDQEFRQHLVDMGHSATKVWSNSQASSRDLLRFWQEAGLEHTPPDIFVMPLASYASSSRLPALKPHDEAIMRDVFGRGDYILYVSSVEPRKNHRMILDIWRDLWLERGAACPQFVYVGMAGWGNGDLLDRVPRMPAYIGGKINWLQHVSDDLLAHLYHNCAFTLFPSLYEGWGLAATESLAFGKVCVVSNNSSLGEATQGLMPSYHPLDFPGWKKEIDRLLDDWNYRKSLERKISDRYRNVTWDDFGKQFCDQLVLGN
ncbi:MAG: glycosyltransferase [Sphingobium sp.]